MGKSQDTLLVYFQDKPTVLLVGMRVSELVALSMSDIDLVDGIIHIYRQKTDTESQLDMPVPLRQILRDYLKVRSELLPRAMSKRAVQGCVQRLGQDILGIDDLSPYDMRHSIVWPKRLQRRK